MNRVLVIRGRAKAYRNFKDEEVGKKFFEMAKRRFGPENVYLISCTKAIPPPPGFNPNGTPVWCPYCGAEREFVYYPRWETKVCSICGISDRDYHLRRFNKSWPGEGKGLSSSTKSKNRRKARRERKLSSKEGES